MVIILCFIMTSVNIRFFFNRSQIGLEQLIKTGVMQVSVEMSHLVTHVVDVLCHRRNFFICFFLQISMPVSLAWVASMHTTTKKTRAASSLWTLSRPRSPFTNVLDSVSTRLVKFVIKHNLFLALWLLSEDSVFFNAATKSSPGKRALAESSAESISSPVKNCQE